jgi:hypothetical protein
MSSRATNENIGGYRGTKARRRFTRQLVALVTAADRDRVDRLCETYGLGQSTVMRAVIDRGLRPLESELADGSVKPDTLV